MRRVRQLLFRATWTRRALSCATLAMYLAVVFGLPLPAVARKTGDQPYPCQSNPCGCSSAEQCWRSCCCMTPEQRFAWAERHGITPPDYAERPQSQSWRTPPRQTQEPSAPKKTCCSHQEPSEETPEKCESCRDSEDGTCTVTPSCQSKSPSDKNKTSRGFVLGIAALKCQGLTSLWMTAGLAPPPTPWLTWQPGFEPEGWVRLVDLDLPSRSLLPPLPPPRDCVA